MQNHDLSLGFINVAAISCISQTDIILEPIYRESGRISGGRPILAKINIARWLVGASKNNP